MKSLPTRTELHAPGASIAIARRETGLDLLRLLAMAVVAAQHGLTAVGHYDWTVLTASGVTIGQFGVAIFCAISGWFAVGGDDPPLRWLAARLVRLFPAYWITTLFAFGLAIAMARPITLGLFISQMAGTGFFTHGWDLVNVVSWFISLILLCYLLTTVARWTTRPGLTMALFCAGAALLVALQLEVSLSRHVIVFMAAAMARTYRRPQMLLWLAVALVPLLAIQSSFIYAIAALPVLWLFRERVAVVSALVATSAAYTYEFFLVHGIFLAGAAKLTGSAPLAIAIGLGCSLPAAVLVKRAAALLTTAARSILPIAMRSPGKPSVRKRA